MTEMNTKHLQLLGKEVSFIHCFKPFPQFSADLETVSGVVTQLMLDSSGEHEISIDHGEFYNLKEILEFKVLDSIN